MPPMQPVTTVCRNWLSLLQNYVLHATVGICGIFLMPLFIVSHRFKEKFFAFIYVIVQRRMEDEVNLLRKIVMSQLNDMSSQVPSLNARGALRVLEVGAAYGPNLEFVQRPIDYWVVEPNRSFEESFRRNLKANPNVELNELIVGHGEDMRMLPDCHFDAVVLFFVLCSAKDGSKLLSECKRVLKKGGRLLFAEHVAHEEGTFSRFIQNAVTPLTKKFACGCHMNRESGAVLKGISNRRRFIFLLPTCRKLSDRVCTCYGCGIDEKVTVHTILGGQLCTSRVSNMSAPHTHDGKAIGMSRTPLILSDTPEIGNEDTAILFRRVGLNNMQQELAATLKTGRHSSRPLGAVLHQWIHRFLNYALLVAVGIGGIFCLPVLLASNKFRDVFFSYTYVRIQRFMEDEMAVVRRAVLSQLDAVVSRDSSLKAHGAIRVLEVGAAYGPNVEFLRRPVKYWALEPNTSFQAALERNVKSNPNVEMGRFICGYGEDMAMIPERHFDAVLLMFVLCTATDGSKILSECKRLLAKGGYLLFAEHVGHKKGTFPRFLQDVLTPYTKNLTSGCHMNRDSEALLTGAGFSEIEVNRITLDIPFVLNQAIYGIAIA
ncbi:hypothetical protein HPB50_012169 [Hyalomma asiaticum]|uniref:Uncharacterized protein n=1 Tax=Hyalomma asiaticum TaxID=266040 RepID=A0ACB7S0I1_HYAAI|nr:hypothetical protein HPB50_012169 [Hyalomma asiaticum]